MQNGLSSALSRLTTASAIVAQTDTQQNSCTHTAAAATATALFADTQTNAATSGKCVQSGTLGYVHLEQRLNLDA